MLALLMIHPKKKRCCLEFVEYLGGGLKDFFILIPGEMIQFDLRIFFNCVETTFGRILVDLLMLNECFQNMVKKITAWAMMKS